MYLLFYVPTGPKKRIPAWCDRILFVPSLSSSRPRADSITTNVTAESEKRLQCVAYDSDATVKTSDHRPVYASFVLNLIPRRQSNNNPTATGATSSETGDNQDDIAYPPTFHDPLSKKVIPAFASESQVCTIM